jgi:proline iminopeptidase
VHDLFPDLSPYRTFRLRVSPLHELHVEEAGNPHGKPVVFFHGGPGAGIAPIHRRFFDPAFWRVILFDQRGSGKSTPLGELRENTTWDLVADTEKIRELLGIEQWLVFGGSWGSTLALAYAETHPERVQGLIVRGIFLGRRAEVAWTFGEGLQMIYPDAWDEFLAPLSEAERKDPMRSYHARLVNGDEKTRRAAALAWNLWEERASYLLPEEMKPPAEEDVPAEVALARIEGHYFVNGSFFRSDGELLTGAGRIAKIPGVIIQGRYDLVCPAGSAWDLHKAWPLSRIQFIRDAGHAAGEPGIASALVEATEEFKGRV